MVTDGDEQEHWRVAKRGEVESHIIEFNDEVTDRGGLEFGAGAQQTGAAWRSPSGGTEDAELEQGRPWHGRNGWRASWS